MQDQIAGRKRVALWLAGIFFSLLGAGLLVLALVDWKGLVYYRGTFYNGQPLGGFYMLPFGLVMVLFGVLLIRRLLKR